MSRIDDFKRDVDDVLFWDKRVHFVKGLLGRATDAETRAELEECLRIARDARRRSWRGENRPRRTAGEETLAAIVEALAGALV